MARFQFSGDPNGPAEALETKEAFGLQFEPGEFTEVEDEAVIAKLRANSHFTEEGSEPPAKRKAGRPKRGE